VEEQETQSSIAIIDWSNTQTWPQLTSTALMDVEPGRLFIRLPASESAPSPEGQLGG
jgi:hypothetical protein